MSRAYSDLAFTPAVRAEQTRLGSRQSYAAFDTTEDRRDALGEREAEFIAARDSFYQATVSENGWPYVQFRGGPAGFLKVLDEKTLAYADFRGNRQYISVGNLHGNDRVSIILMDYPNRARLKLLGRVKLVDDDAALLAQLQSPDYRARVERAVVIMIEAYDWNCPQHITPRFTEAEVEAVVAPLREKVAVLEKRNPITSHAPGKIGEGPLELSIRGMRDLTPRVRAFTLARTDGAALPVVEPGAHLALPVPPDHAGAAAHVTRRYSIARVLDDGHAWEVAVQREDGGHGGSRAIHRLFRLGMTLGCALPQNHFGLHADARPAVLIAGGIGITPIRAMVERLATAGRAFALHYAARSTVEAAYGRDLAGLAGGSYRLADKTKGQRLDVAAIMKSAPADAVFYVCGPAALVDAATGLAATLGIDADRVRVERFAASAEGEDRPVTVHLARSAITLRVAPQQSILEAVEAAGVEVAASCRTGQCGTCVVKVIAGEPAHRDVALNDHERQRAGLMCICVSRAAGEELTLDI